MQLHQLAEDQLQADDNDEAWNMDEHRLMERYNESKPAFVAITEIVVPTERDKQQLLRAFKYIHDNRTIDSEYYAVNTLMHMYQCPDRIKVKE